MQANSVNFMNEILINNRFYYIPVYQRNYSWEEEQCKKLFEDIKKIYDGEYEEHFIGSIVWKPDDGNTSNLSVIDGQQRLTSMFLLINAMRSLSNHEKLNIKLDSIIKDDISGEIRLKPIKSDNEVYEEIVKSEFNDIKKKNSRIYLNYSYFKEQIQKENMDILKLYRSIEKLSAIRMELHQKDNPQIIFESINSTGMSLSIADLIRNYLLMNESYDIQKLLFERYWDKFEQKLGVDNLIYFFEQYLNLKLSDQIINRNKMYQYFKSYFKNNNFTAEELLKSIEPYINIYEKLCNENINFEFNDSQINDEINSLKNQILLLENRTSFMFLMPTILDYENGKITIENLKYAFELVLSYLFRRNVIGLVTNVLQGNFRRLHKQVNENLEKYSYKNALDYALIISKQNTRSYFPQNNEFIEALKNRQLYGKFKFTKYLLLSLENDGNKTKFSEEEFTIEHVMPQKLTQQWKEDLGQDWKNIQEEKLNLIGNLTLTSYNSELSNNSFVIKKEKLFEERHIKLNDYFVDLLIWNADSIDIRSDFLANKATNLWKYPTINELLEADIQEEKYNSISLLEISNDYITIKPVILVIDEQEYHVKSFRDIVKEIIKYSIIENKANFEKTFVNNENYTRIMKDVIYYKISKEDNKVAYPKKVDEYYFDCHANGHNLCKLANDIMDCNNVNTEKIIIKYYK